MLQMQLKNFLQKQDNLNLNHDTLMKDYFVILTI